MYRLIVSLVTLGFFAGSLEMLAQNENLEVQGAIQIANSSDPTPDAGTIRFNSNTNDFEGWNGYHWMSLTQYAEEGDGVTDFQGVYYKTIKLGTQEWMAQNLRSFKYNDGEDIPQDTSTASWLSRTTGAWCWYDNYPPHEIPHGKLYNFYAVESKKLCPQNWHVPKYNDWEILANYLGGAGVAGDKMKLTGTDFWVAPNSGATNKSKFSAYPSGLRDISGAFAAQGHATEWWTSEINESNDEGYFARIQASDDNLNLFDQAKNRGKSIRCVKD